MNNYSSASFQMGPQKTPIVIKNLIIFTLSITTFAAITNNLFVFLFSAPGPMDWLTLSWWGLKNYFIWQPLTYLFSYHTGEQGINLSFISDIAFNMFLLWVFGSDLVNRMSKNSFLKFYFLSGIFSGLVSLLFMPITHRYGIISGAMPSIISLMILWTLMNPNSRLFLFFLIPIKAKWLTFGLVGSMILLSLSRVDMIHFFLYSASALFGYFYALLVRDIHGPFPSLYKFELMAIRFFGKIKSLLKPFFGKSSMKGKKASTVVDFSTGQDEMSDEKFIDKMLEKISKTGESSLSWQERERMKRISEKKQRK